MWGFKSLLAHKAQGGEAARNVLWWVEGALRASSSSRRGPTTRSWSRRRGSGSRSGSRLVPVLTTDANHTQVWTPTVAEFRLALAKGLGRTAVFAAQSALPADYVSVLVEECFEPSAWFAGDDEHAEWVAQLALAAGARSDLTRRALVAAHEEREPDRLERVCVVLQMLAAGGSAEAKAVLYAVVRDNLRPDEPVAGWPDVLALDGPEAFVTVVRDVFDDPRLLDSLVQGMGDDALQATAHRLDALSLPDDAKRALRRALDDLTAARAAPKQDREAWLRTLSANDVLEAAKDNKAGWFRGWAKIASESDLHEVMEVMLGERNVEILRRLLSAFTARPLPALEERLLGLVQHDDDRVRGRAIRTIAQYRNPKVRELALVRLRNLEDAGIVLLIHNYDAGDYKRVEPLFDGVSDPDVLHGRGFNLLEVFEHNPLAELSPLVEVVYEVTPCSLCREKAVKLLLAAKLAPGWMIDECRHDAFEDIRKLVA